MLHYSPYRTLSRVLCFACIVPTDAFVLKREANSSQPGIIHLPLEVSDIPKLQSNSTLPPDRDSRQAQADVYRWGLELKSYVMPVYVGTPPQKVLIEPDLGSKMLWMLTTEQEATSVLSSQFDLDRSSSKKYLGKKGDITYVGSSVTYQTYEEEISLSPSLLPSRVEIGMAKAIMDPSRQWGVLGLTMTGSGADMMDDLIQRGSIRSKLLSFNYASSGGFMTLGGVDVKKFSGPLQAVPIIPTSYDANVAFQTDDPNSFNMHKIRMDRLSITNADGAKTTIFDENSASMNRDYIVDSGTADCVFPSPVWRQIVKRLPPIDPLDRRVDCSAIRNTKGSLDLSFGSTTISIPLNKLYYDTYQGCYIAARRGRFRLGSTFMSHVYMAIDYTTHIVYLAPNADCGSEIIPISDSPGSGSDIASMVGKCPATS